MSDSENQPSAVPSVDGVVHTPGPWEVFGIIGKPGLMHVRACVGDDAKPV